MGYEIRLYAGELSAIKSDAGDTYMDCILSIDLSKPGYDSNVSAAADDSGISVYFYYGEKISSDDYADRVKAYPLRTVIDALEKDTAISKYRRFASALACMKSLDNDMYTNVYVAFVGH